MEHSRKIVLIFIVSILGTLASCGGAEDRKNVYLKKAKASLEQGNYEKAKIDLKNVVQIDPKHSEAYYLIGTIEEKLGNVRQAISLYAKSAELDENNIPAKYKLGAFYLRLGNIDKALEEADFIDKKFPGSAEAKGLYAGVAYFRKEYKKAIDIISDIEEEKREVDLYELLAAAHHTSNDIDGSIKALKTGIIYHQDSISLRRHLARVYSDENTIELAAEQLNYLIDANPEELENYIVLSALFLKHDDKERAEKVYRDLVKKYPDNRDYQILLARYIAVNIGLPESIEYLNTLVEKYPDIETYKITLAKLHISYGNKDIDEAKQLLNRVINDNVTDKGVESAKNLLAELLINTKNTEDAEKLLSEVLDDNPGNVRANFLKAKLLLTHNNFNDAINSLRIVVKETPQNGMAHVLLASAHESLGNKDLAFDTISKGVLESPNNIDLLKIYMRKLIEKGKHDYALGFLEKVRFNVSDTYVMSELRGELLVINKKYDDAEKVGNELLKTYPEKEAGYKILANTYANQGKLEDASAISKDGYEKLLMPSLLVGYVRSEVALGRDSSVIKYLESNSDHKALSYKLLAEMYARAGDMDKAISMFNEAIAHNKLWDAPYIGLASLYISQKKNTEAINVYDLAIKNIENNNKFRFIKAEALHKFGDLDQAIDIYEAVLSEDETNVIANNNLAVILVDEFDDPQLTERAFRLTHHIKDLPNIALKDTAGWVLAKYGKHDEAIAILKEIVYEKPDIAIFNYHLGMAYYFKGDVSAARPFLEKAVDNDVKTEWSKKAKAILEKTS